MKVGNSRRRIGTRKLIVFLLALCFGLAGMVPVRAAVFTDSAGPEGAVDKTNSPGGFLIERGGHENDIKGGLIFLDHTLSGPAQINATLRSIVNVNGSLMINTDGNGTLQRILVNGDALTAQMNGTVIHDTDDNTSIDVEANPNEDMIRFTTAGNEVFVIDANGRLGVGLLDNSAAYGANGSLLNVNGSIGIADGIVPSGPTAGFGKLFVNGDQLFFMDSTGTIKQLDATTDLNGSISINLGGDATGDMYYRDAGGNFARLALGTAGQQLLVNGTTGLPEWTDVAVTEVSNGTISNTIIENGTYINGNVINTIIDNSTFVNGNILNSTIENGTYINGDIINTTIENGTYINGDILNTTIEGSTFVNGDILNTTIENGTYVNGSIFNSYIDNGTFTNGNLTNVVINGLTLDINGIALGDLFYSDANGELQRLPIGSQDEILKVDSGVPVWGAEPILQGNGNIIEDSVDHDTYITVEKQLNDDYIHMAVNGYEAVVIDVNGEVGIGNVGANAALTVNGATSYKDFAARAIPDPDSGFGKVYMNGNDLFYVNDAGGRFKLNVADEAGNLTSSPNSLRVIALDAANGESAHPITDDLKVTFSSLILAESIDSKFVKIRRRNDDSLHFNLDVLSSEVSVSANELTINPPSDLNYDTDYYVEIDTGLVNSAINITEEWSGFTGNGNWFFKTALAPDINDTAFSPNGSGVDSRVTTLTIDFNNDITLNAGAAGNVVVVRDNGDDFAAIAEYPAGDGNLSASGNRLTITIPTPSDNTDDLEFGEIYYVQIAADFIENANKATNFFTEFNNQTSWRFTVENAPAFSVGSFSFTPTGTANRTNNLRMTSNIPVTINGGVANAVQIFNADNNSLVASLSSDQISMLGQNTLDMGAFGSGPLPKLVYENGYYIHVASDWVMNSEVDGEDFAGFTDNSTWAFTAENIPSITPVQETLAFNVTDPAVQPADLEGSIDLKDFSGYETNVTKISMIHSSIGAFVERSQVEALVSINNEGKATSITFYDEGNVQQTTNFSVGSTDPDFDAGRWFEIPSREYEFSIRDVAGEQKLILRSLPNGIGQYASHSVDVRYTND